MPQRGTRKTTQASAPVEQAAQVEQPVVQAQPPFQPYQQYEAGINWTAVLVVILLIAVLLLGFIAFSDRFNHSSDRSDERDDRDRGRRADARLVEDIEDALDGPDARIDAKIFALACGRYADRLEDEFKVGAGLFDTKQELINLTGIAAYFMTAAEGRNEYRRLPEVFEDFNREFFSDESGAATDDDREKLIDYFRELESAFNEVAE